MLSERRFNRGIKCDETRPLCNYCRAGGLRCMGYEPRLASIPLARHNRILPAMSIFMSQPYSNSVTSFPQPTVPNNARRHLSTPNGPQAGSDDQERPFSDTDARYWEQQAQEAIKYIHNRLYEARFGIVLFRPARIDVKIIRHHFVSLMLVSDIYRCSSYVAARMLYAHRRDGEYAYLNRFAALLERLGQTCVKAINANVSNTTAGLSSVIELLFLKNMASGIRSSHTLLRRIAPALNQVAYSDPSLHPSDPYASGISLVGALSSPRLEVGRFVMMDIIASLTLDVPPLIKYDASYPTGLVQVRYRTDTLYGCPARFVCSIARINRWRADRPSGCPPWKKIEDDTWAWRSRGDYGPEPESSLVVARLAVQEAWRHAVLIYLYMGMCGLTNHHDLVQSSVSQIGQLLTTVRSEQMVRIHMLVPIFVAAVCTRLEIERKQFRAVISQAGYLTTLILNGHELTAVLDRLWKGAGANGKAITWEDYVDVRRAVIILGRRNATKVDLLALVVVKEGTNVWVMGGMLGRDLDVIKMGRRSVLPDDGDRSTDSSSMTQDWAIAIQQTRSYGTVVESSVGYTMPPMFIPNAEMSGKTIRFIVSHYEPLFELVFFRPMETLLKEVSVRFAMRLARSKLVHWSSFIGAQMFTLLKRDRENADVQRYTPWLDRLDQLCVVSDDTSLEGMVNRLSGALELIFLKYMTSNPKSGYTLLRRMAPIFMHIAFADPMLWPRDPSSSGISLAHALASGRYEIGRFIYEDTIWSLMFGVPQLVEYDTSHPPIAVPGAYPTEWVHGCPVRFAFAIIKINQWRAKHPNGGSQEGSAWKEIEEDILSWRPSCDYGPDSESGRLVMRFGIQEAWRHALLIYLYMAMCGVTSHDPRVRSSVRQISRLHAAVNTQFTSGMHLMVPLLLAAICARSEGDRRTFRAAISIAARSKSWLLKGTEFTPVVDHLWHGAAANGAPVTWDDYVNARRAVMDVGV
ncbi:Fungal specific transcription factor domain [Ceratobasidium sp. AG-Ba]|nr:Fungal specific transcription factor domain [Ceratobasidium sp. AG-Ba]